MNKTLFIIVALLFVASAMPVSATYSGNNTWVPSYNVQETKVGGTYIQDSGIKFGMKNDARILEFDKDDYTQMIGNCTIKLADSPYTIIDTGTWNGLICTITNPSVLNKSTYYAFVSNVSGNFAYYSTGSIATTSPIDFNVTCGIQNMGTCYPNFGPWITKVISQNYTASSSSPTSITLYLNSSSANFSGTYPTALNVSATINVTGLWVALYQNASLISNGTTSITNITSLKAGTYNFTGNYTGNSSYDGSTSTTFWATISKASNPLTLTNNTSLTGVYPYVVNITGNGNTTPAYLYRNNSLVTNPNTDLVGAGAWNYTWNTSGDENHSSNMTSLILTVTQGGQSISLTGIANNTYPYSVTPVCTGNVTANLYRNGTSASNSTAVQLGVGVYSWVCNTTANANYTFNTATVVQSVSQASSWCSLSFNPVSPINYTTPFSALCICNTTEGTTKLWHDNNSDSNFVDHTAENNTNVIYSWGNFQYICNTTNTQNYSSATNSSTYSINKLNPTLNITFNTSDSVVQGTIVQATCNKPSLVTVSLYNDTSVVSNPYSLDTTGMSGIYNFTCNNTANYNMTASSSTNNLTVTLMGGLYIVVYDELTPTSSLTFNTTVFNSTLSNTKYNQNPYQNTTLSGYITIYYWASGYPQRNRYVYVGSGNSTSVTAYLLDSTHGQYVSFYVLGYQGQPIVNALVQATTLINSTQQIADEETTDSTGIATLWLDYNNLYYISINYGGTTYLTNSSLIPSQTLYRYYINPYNATNTSTPFTNMNVTILPQSISLPMSISQTFSCAVASADSQLVYYGHNLTLANGTSFYLNYTSTTGGTVTKSLNLTQLFLSNQTQITYDCFFGKYNFSEVDLVTTYYIYNDTSIGGQGLEKSFVEAQGLGFGVLALGIISLVISGLVGGFMGRFNSLAGGLTCVLLLGFMWYYLGLFTILPFQIGGIYLLICLTTVSVIYLRGGI